MRHLIAEVFELIELIEHVETGDAKG
jgi:hypothetical protein